MTTFAERLRTIRSKRSLSQAKLARSCGLSQSAIANYENGTRKTTKNVFGIAEALNVNPQWLATGSGSMEPLSANPAPQTSYHLNEPSPPDIFWPFLDITPEQYLTLSEAKRANAEIFIKGLLQGQRQEKDNS